MKKNSKNEEFTTSEFLTRIKSREPVAIDSLVDAYTDHLYRGALGLGFSGEVAKELVQNVWLVFFEVIPGFEGRSHIRTFLFGILLNKARELRREQSKDSAHDQFDEVFEKNFDEKGHWVSPPINPEQFLASAQNMQLIKDCIDGLPLAQRMAFCLREIDEHKSEDICNILEVSGTNLGVLIFRARNKLRDCIEKKSNPAR